MQTQNINKILIVAIITLVVILGIQNWPEPKAQGDPIVKRDYPTEYSVPIEYSDMEGSTISGHIYVVDDEDYYLMQIICNYTIPVSCSNLCVNTPNSYKIAMFWGYNDHGLMNNPEVLPSDDGFTHLRIIGNSDCTESGHFSIEYHFDKNTTTFDQLSIEYTDQENCHHHWEMTST